jgi:hypothetical protein
LSEPVAKNPALSITIHNQITQKSRTLIKPPLILNSPEKGLHPDIIAESVVLERFPISPSLPVETI